MEINKILSMIGLSKKAGRLLEGNERVIEASWTGRVSLIIIAEDLAEARRKNLQRIASESGTPYCILPVTMQELGERLGSRPVGILGVTDHGLATAIEKLVVALS